MSATGDHSSRRKGVTYTAVLTARAQVALGRGMSLILGSIAVGRDAVGHGGQFVGGLGEKGWCRSRISDPNCWVWCLGTGLSRKMEE